MPARAIPDPLPDYVRTNLLRSAEVRVYDALCSQLSSRYILFYSRPWTGTRPDGTEKDGEADFVVASAETGYLVLEVKGGGIGRNSAKDEWHSTDRDGRQHKIKNPVEQARTNKYEILERLKQRAEMRDRWIDAAYGVIFPDSTGAGSLIGIDTPADHFALREDMPHLGEWVQKRLARAPGSTNGSLGNDGLSALEQLLAKSFQLRVPLAGAVDSIHRGIVTATETQYALLEFFADHTRAKIAGAAGCGKTVLALHHAMEVAAQNPSSRILLTCYNAPLAAWLRRAAPALPNLHVATFQSTCLDLAKKAGIALPDHDAPRYYDDVLPDALLQAVAQRNDLSFDTVIVDEGQDFSDEWLKALEQSLRSQNSCFWIFYDDNQTLYTRCSTFLSDMPQAPFRLRRNVRNTKTVFERLRPLLRDTSISAIGPSGRTVEELAVPDHALLLGRLNSLISHLLDDEQFAAQDIAVLVTNKDAISELCPRGRLGRTSICKADEEPGGRICVDTVRRFKGLERKVIVLWQPAEMAREEDLLYVAISRAAGHLILIGSEMPRDMFVQQAGTKTASL